MKIHEFNRAGAVNPYRKSQEAAPGDNVKNKRPAKDQLQISTQAKELLEAQASSDPRRAERIAELKQSVQDGTYHVPAGHIAEKLLCYLVNDPS